MPLRIVQLGLSGAAQAWWEAFDAVDGLQPVGLVDPDPEALCAAAGRYAVPRNACFEDWNDPWDAVPADLIVDASPAPQHHSNAMRAIHSKSHLIVGAPLAARVDQAHEIVDTAERAGCKVVVAQPLRFHPLSLKLRDVVFENRIGPLQHADIEFRAAHSDGDPEPVVVEGACHHLDMIRWCLMQDGIRAEADGSNAFTFQMDRGAKAAYRIVTGSDRPTGWLADWTVTGRDKTMRLKDHRIHLDDEDITPEWHDQAPIAEVRIGRLYQVILNHTFLYLDNLAEPCVSGPNNLNSLAMVSAALQSRAEGRPLEVPR